jgi:hypothetical protein
MDRNGGENDDDGDYLVALGTPHPDRRQAHMCSLFPAGLACSSTSDKDEKASVCRNRL